jgi:hypothetical protein
VKDASKLAGFSLKGPGLSRSTAKAFTGTVTWKVTLKKGSTYRYGSGLAVKVA